MAIVTLSTDFHTNDFIVGAMKGQLLSQDAALTIVDITHELQSGNFLQIAYLCKSAWSFYPKDSVHVLLHDVYKSSLTELLVAAYDDYFIVCPNNGIITMLLYQLQYQLVKVPLPKIENTLDITAAVAAIVRELTKGKYLRQIGMPLEEHDLKEVFPLFKVDANAIIADIIFIDKNQNAITNITKDYFEKVRNGRSFAIALSSWDVLTTISTHYKAVPDGEILAWFNAANHLEIAVNNGSMASLLGFTDIRKGENNNPTYRSSIRIEFK